MVGAAKLDYVLAQEALQDLQDIWDFISADNASAADHVVDELFKAFERLVEFPGLGHPRRDLTQHDVLFWPVSSYLIVYRKQKTLLQIAAVLHAARDISTVLRNR